MKLETFFENFELLADAPNGVQKLRELILQMAVQGKLVSQDPNDDPASVLLEKIKAEKEQLVKEGKIKNFNNISTTALNNVPYKLPESWKWVRLEDVSLILMGQSPPGDTYNSESKGVPLINGPVEFGPNPFSETVLNKFTTSPTKMCKKGDLLICVRGSTTGRTNIAGFEACIGRGVAAIRAFAFQEFVNQFVLASRQKIFALGTGSTFPSVSCERIASFPFPLPPLNEQKRIVAKVYQLMTLCDRLEERQQKRRTTRILLNNVALDQLLTAREPDDFSKYWQRICDNFDLLYSTPENISKLRQAILQLAVMGKLVPQDPNDEPASVLLEKIKFEKEQLVQDGKISKLQEFPPVLQNEIFYQLPINWSWVRLGEVLVFGPRNGYSPKPVDYPTNIKSITLSATTSGEFKSHYFKYIDEEIELDSHLWLENSDLLIQRANTIEYVGIAAVYKGLSSEYIYPDLIMKLRLSKFVEIDYFHRAINSECSRNFLRAKASGTSSNMPKINQATVNSLPIPLPPKAEQKRIVAKVNELMALCDRLETKLTQSVTDSEKLMDAAVRQLLAVNSKPTEPLLKSTRVEPAKTARHNKRTQQQDTEAAQLNLLGFE